MRQIASLVLFALPLLSLGQAGLQVVMLLEKPALAGTLRVALCASRKAYNSGMGCIEGSVPVNASSATCDFPGLAPGTYAVKVFQDVDDDGLLDTSWLGWPTEPVGYSNDAPINTGTPPFGSAAIALGPGRHTARIRVR
ncbi:MAG: DUF2141 domain-containing protein [Flavobacteriales bacterium]|nr:DUF2141 domain-containing protein [Flavobacteriales bacterium]MBP9079629.1 DUF2141 domain-containing protein [Flavobacteriales bacterium]